VLRFMNWKFLSDLNVIIASGTFKMRRAGHVFGFEAMMDVKVTAVPAGTDGAAACGHCGFSQAARAASHQ